MYEIGRTTQGWATRNGKSLHGQTPFPLTAKIATTAHDMQVACRLRYKAYVNAGYLEKTAFHLFSDIYDTRPSSKTILIFRGAIPVGSVRVCLLDPNMPEASDIPASHMFQEEINALLTNPSRGEKIGKAVEITRLARDPDFADDRQVTAAMFRMAGYVVLAERADVVFVAVTPGHMPLYRRMGYQKVGEPKDYPGLDVKTCLMACFRDDYGSVQRHVSILRDVSHDDATFVAFTAGEQVAVFGPDPLPANDYTIRSRANRPPLTTAARQ